MCEFGRENTVLLQRRLSACKPDCLWNGKRMLNSSLENSAFIKIKILCSVELGLIKMAEIGVWLARILISDPTIFKQTINK